MQVLLFTEAGFEIYAMQLIEVEKYTHMRRDNDYFSVLEKYKSRLGACGNFETTERLRTDSPAGDVDSHRLTFPFMHAISRTGTFKDQKVTESWCIVFQLKAFQKALLVERF